MYSRSTGEVNSNSYVFATSKVNPKLERLLSKSLTTLEVKAHYLVVHTGPVSDICEWKHQLKQCCIGSSTKTSCKDMSITTVHENPNFSNTSGINISMCNSIHTNRLVGLVVKASASRAGGPGFESR